jgi:Transglutaminase-like superfamily
VAASIRAFETWGDIAKWYTELADPQAEPDETVAAKARELTANAKTELEKIQAIGRYVQNIQYVSIQIGIGGWRPHSAREVFAKQYGDCKDKATLMRAMLRAVKLDSYAVLIFSGDRTYVREELASPGQFNHCILAVRVGPETQAPAVIEHAKLGRLLIFDATDASTPVGDLPDDEQGSFALIAAGADGGLVRMPMRPPEDNLWKREIEAGLSADGSLTATVRERLLGQSAVSFRRAFRGLAKSDFSKLIERWVSGGATGAKFMKIEPADDHGGGRFALDVEFSAARYAQSMQDRLLVFRPAVISHDNAPPLAEPTRKHPVVLESQAFSETVRVKLPEGFEVDEMPDAVKLNSEFGDYTATYEIKEGHLVFTRTLVQRASVVPAARYKEVRDFFGRVRTSEESPVVLARK